MIANVSFKTYTTINNIIHTHIPTNTYINNTSRGYYLVFERDYNLLLFSFKRARVFGVQRREKKRKKEGRERGKAWFRVRVCGELERRKRG